ncbi:DUF6465 family protein [Mediterraneibacter gnavus]|uniref:DUF6465 family protein n=1 Tax=Mediterraneibacter gnavus TaxID=33038 RepID=UPI00232DC5C3|nr:DUF6465 family protein [Mediterraneibacter gnavus]MDB8711554.1 DUF6465 family protein [Mediterraneibacter gnavus]MDB8714869.1 DUF6465 family protein [Mediterraneibacter gnavus]
MSKRLDKKKLKKQTTAIESPITETSASKETINFFIQYQDQEYLETEIVSRVRESCLLNGASSDELNTISIYLKPEDKKAYFTYGEDKSGFIEL